MLALLFEILFTCSSLTDQAVDIIVVYLNIFVRILYYSAVYPRYTTIIINANKQVDYNEKKP